MKYALRDTLLAGSSEEIQELLDKKYMYTNYKKADQLISDLEDISNLDRKTLEISIIRLKSMEELYDPSKSVTIIIGIIVIMLSAYTDFFGDLFKDIVIIFISKVVVFGGALIWLAEQIQKMRFKKCKLLYFKGLLENELAARDLEQSMK